MPHLRREHPGPVLGVDVVADHRRHAGDAVPERRRDVRRGGRGARCRASVEACAPPAGVDEEPPPHARQHQAPPRARAPPADTPLPGHARPHSSGRRPGATSDAISPPPDRPPDSRAEAQTTSGRAVGGIGLGRLVAAGEVLVDRRRRGPALRDRPDDQRLAAARRRRPRTRRPRSRRTTRRGRRCRARRGRRRAARAARAARGPVKPIASSTSPAGISRSVPATGWNDASTSTSRSARTRPDSSPRNSWVETA